MNSNKIKENHPHVYETFFRKCDVVCSCPGVFFWAGEHAVLCGAPAIAQHVPLRVYVGLEKIKDKKFPAYEGKYPLYEAWSGKFSQNFDLTSESRKLGEVINVTRNLCMENNFHIPFRLHVLNELMPSMGCNWSGAFSAALSGAIHILNGKTNEEQFLKWEDEEIHKLIDMDTFEAIYRFAWKLETIFHGTSASGYGPFCSLIPEKQPILFITAERSDSEDSKFKISIKADSLNEIDHIPFSGFSFKKISRNIDWNNIAVGLISSGKQKDTGEQIKQKKARTKKYLADALEILFQYYFDDIIKYLGLTNPLIDGEIKNKLINIKNGKEDPRYYFYRAQELAILEVFGTLSKFLTEEGNAEDNMKYLAETLKGVQGGLELMKFGWWEFQEISSLVYEIAQRENAWDKTALKLTGGGGGGWILFVCPGEIQEEVKNVLEQEKYKNNKICLIWLMAEDGLEEKGIKIERQLVRYPHKIIQSHFPKLILELVKFAEKKIDEERDYKHNAIDIVDNWIEEYSSSGRISWDKTKIEIANNIKRINSEIIDFFEDRCEKYNYKPEIFEIYKQEKDIRELLYNIDCPPSLEMLKNLNQRIYRLKINYNKIFRIDEVCDEFCKERKIKNEITISKELNKPGRLLAISPSLIKTLLGILLDNSKKYNGTPKVVLSERDNKILLLFESASQSEGGWLSILDENDLKRSMEKDAYEYLKEYERILEYFPQKLKTAILICSLHNAIFEIKIRNLKFRLHEGFSVEKTGLDDNTVNFEIYIPFQG